MTQAMQLTFRDRILEIIKELGCVSMQEVVARDMPNDWSTFAYRGISVIMDGEREGAGTVRQDDYGYRFLIVFCSGSSKGSSTGTADWVSEARTEVRRRFNNKRLSEIPCAIICGVDNGDFLAKKPWENAKSVSVLTITAWAREVRS